MTTFQTFRGSLIGHAPLNRRHLNGREWVLNVKLENGQNAYILSDIGDLPKEYRCHMTSQLMDLTPGTQLRVEVIDWAGVKVITAMERMPVEQLSTCGTCAHLETYTVNSEHLIESVSQVVEGLRQMISAKKVSEFAQKHRPLAGEQVYLAKFAPGALPMGYGGSLVFIVCKKCKAEWVLSFYMDRSSPGFWKIREGFKF